MWDPRPCHAAWLVLVSTPPYVEGLSKPLSPSSVIIVRSKNGFTTIGHGKNFHEEYTGGQDYNYSWSPEFTVGMPTIK